MTTTSKQERDEFLDAMQRARPDMVPDNFYARIVHDADLAASLSESAAATAAEVEQLRAENAAMRHECANKYEAIVSGREREQALHFQLEAEHEEMSAACSRVQAMEEALVQLRNALDAGRAMLESLVAPIETFYLDTGEGECSGMLCQSCGQQGDTADEIEHEDCDRVAVLATLETVHAALASAK